MPSRRTAWLGLFAAALLVVAAGFADRKLKVATHPGFLPEDMPLCVYSADLPASWLHFSRTPPGESLADEAALVLHSVELSVRQLTGIRPTPARWQTWLGPSAAVASDGRDWILCTRPGLVARAASLVFGGKALPGKKLHQAWRQGYLLLSTNPKLIDKALTAPPVVLDIPEAAAPDTLVIETHAPVRMVASLKPSFGIPVEVRCFPPEAIAPGTPAAWNAPPLSGDPILSLSLRDAQSAAHLAALVYALNLPDFTGGMLGELVERWSINRLSTFLFGAGAMSAPVSIALYGLSTTSEVPLPLVALASSAKDGFAAPLPASQFPNRLIPYEWNGCPGWMFPIFGDQFSLHGFRRDGIQYLATRESLAAMLASAPRAPTSDIEDDLVMVMDWKRATAAIKEVAAWAAARELLPERNLKDLDATFVPVMNALSHSGTLQLTGKWSSGQLLCSGLLSSIQHREPGQ